MLILILYFFIVIVAIQLTYYLGIFRKFAFAKAQKITPKRIPISVIVCAKNEEENVAKFIPLLAEQNYPDFEIVQDIASGINFRRRGLITILDQVFAGNVSTVVVAHRDRLTRFGYGYS